MGKKDVSGMGRPGCAYRYQKRLSRSIRKGKAG